MVIGFLGKGGSGKSTLSTVFVHFLAGKGKVLAIDADHNMDMTYNLGIEREFPYLGESLAEIKTYVGINPDEESGTAFFLPNDPVFRIFPPDNFTERFSKVVSDKIRVMAGGPHTDNVLYGQSCSHILTTALKIYLPFLELGQDEFSVVDEKAGSDGAGTGIATGLSLAMVCTEPTPHGMKSANQIAEILEFHEVPYEFAFNKIRPGDDIQKAQSSLKKPALFFFDHSDSMTRPTSDIPENVTTQFEKIFNHAKQIIGPAGDQRKNRSKKKYAKAKNFKDPKKSQQA